MSKQLGIHVLGPRYGESVILELPDGGVGVIDSFAARSADHPVITFLKRRFPRLTRLRFFGVTHPHADHCFRAADILDRFKTDEVWMFYPFPVGEILHYYKALAECGARERVEDALELPAGSVALSLLQLRQRIVQHKKKGALRWRQMAGGHPCADFCDGSLRIHYLTPDEQSQLAYGLALADAAERIFNDGPALRAARQVPQPEHNLASGAILVEYGATRALLMADAENRLWADWLASNPPDELRQPVHFLKAAHHGSVNGYYSPLFAAVGRIDRTLAVITPFNHGRVRLPTREGVQALRGHVRDLYCTNREAAANSTGLVWNPVRSLPLPAVPELWSSMIRTNAALARLLVPEARGGGTSESAPPLPPEWLADLRRNSGLWRLIGPEHHMAIPLPDTVEDYVISAFFDNSGHLVRLEAGQGAGRLAV